MVVNNFSLKRTTVPLTITTVLLAFGWFYYFLDIGSLLDAMSDLGRNPVGANTDGSHIDDEGSLSIATGKDGEDGEDGEDGLSIVDGQGAARADGGNGGAGGNGGSGGTAITSGSTGSTASASGGNGGNGGNGGVAINIPS